VQLARHAVSVVVGEDLCCVEHGIVLFELHHGGKLHEKRVVFLVGIGDHGRVGDFFGDGRGWLSDAVH